jgi:hypothetical protein
MRVGRTTLGRRRVGVWMMPGVRRHRFAIRPLWLRSCAVASIAGRSSVLATHRRFGTFRHVLRTSAGNRSSGTARMKHGCVSSPTVDEATPGGGSSTHAGPACSPCELSSPAGRPAGTHLNTCVVAYAVGLCVALAFGQRGIGAAQWVADPYGPFRRGPHSAVTPPRARRDEHGGRHDGQRQRYHGRRPRTGRCRWRGRVS